MVPMPAPNETAAAPQQRPQEDENLPRRTAWVRPDFEAFDTALEVTAYAARD